MINTETFAAIRLLFKCHQCRRRLPKARAGRRAIVQAAVFEYGSQRRAARALGISPSSVRRART